MKILYVVNDANFFISHRLPLALNAKRLGYDVCVVTAPNTGEARLLEAGFTHHALPISRSGLNLLDEYRTYRALRELYQQQQPDLVHHVTAKPVLYGTYAARAVGIKNVVNAVPGMGIVFSRKGIAAKFGRLFINMLYRQAFKHPHMRVIFQNTEDMRAFLDMEIVDKSQAVLIRGSGVDLSLFDPEYWPPQEPVVFVMLARMLRHKGVVEFAKAAEVVKRQHPKWRFLLAGGEDPGNPGSLGAEQLQLDRG